MMRILMSIRRYMSHVYIASPLPLPLRATLTDPDINNGEPFEYGPCKDLSDRFRIYLMSGEYIDRESRPEYDSMADLPKILPRYIYQYEGVTGFHLTQGDIYESEKLEMKKVRAYVRHVVETMGECCLVYQCRSNMLMCVEENRTITMCVDDLDLNVDEFELYCPMIYRFVSRDAAPSLSEVEKFPRYKWGDFPCCVTLLGCNEELPEGFSKEHGLEFPGGVSTPYFGQHKLDSDQKQMGLDERYVDYLNSLSDLPSILPPHLYISGLNPSFYPYGNSGDMEKRRSYVKKLLVYLQDIVDMQGEVWYIRQWQPGKVAKAESVEIRTMKVSDLDVSGDEFEFELCVLYHFVN